MDARAARAEIVVGDSFEEYAPGNLYGQNGAGLAGSGSWTGGYTFVDGSGTNMNVAAGSLQYSNGAITINGGANHVVIGNPSGAVTSGNAVLVRPFTSQSDTVYFSLLYRTTAMVGDDFVQFLVNDDADADNSASLLMSTTYQARMTSDGSAATNGNTTIQPSLGDVMLLVGKISKTGGSTNYNRLDMYVNPSSLTEPVTPSATALRDILRSTLNTFTIRTSRLDANDTYLFDAVRVGTSYSDVVSPISYAAVPEPSSFALVTITVGGWAWRRRRRRVKETATAA